MLYEHSAYCGQWWSTETNLRKVWNYEHIGRKAAEGPPALYFKTETSVDTTHHLNWDTASSKLRQLLLSCEMIGKYKAAFRETNLNDQKAVPEPEQWSQNRYK